MIGNDTDVFSHTRTCVCVRADAGEKGVKVELGKPSGPS